MEKLKDFIYDKNDILVAFLVLVLAAVLICWRMDIIMEYPEKMFSDGTQMEDPQAGDDTQSGDEGQADSEGEEEGGADSASGEGASSDNEGDGETGNGEEDPAVPAEGLWKDGALARDVEVDVYGNSAMAAVQCLVDAGLFENYDEYKKICDDSGLNHEKVSAGSLLFEKGSTKKDVARKINWS